MLAIELCLHLPEDSSPHNWLHKNLAQGFGSRRWPDDDEFKRELVRQGIYPRRKLARYMLLALEEMYGHKEPVDTSNATIEHIMPQSLSNEWKDCLGDDYAIIHREWLDTIGNLTLTGYNSELGNASFNEKKNRLQHTHFELSRELFSFSSWGPAEIETRGKKMAERAVQRWRRD